MSDSNRSGWFFSDYNPKKDEEFALLQQRVEKLETETNERLKQIDDKLEKLIQSNKSLIAYFRTINNKDPRELNYNLRAFSIKQNKLPPAKFVPEHSNTSDL